MSKPLALEIITGLVTTVQFFTEATAAAAGGRGHAPEPQRMVNAIKVFIKDPHSGRERDFTLRNTTVGMHDGHRVTLIRTKPRGHKEPLLLAVVNQSTGQWEERPRAIEAAAHPSGLFGPRWKALGLAVVTWTLGWALSHFVFDDGYDGVGSALIALLFAVLCFPIFWVSLDVWDRFSLRGHKRQTKALVKAEIDHQIAIARAVSTG